jgi:hypothetical protein
MSNKGSKTITVDLVGGLGNQLFGLAFGSSISRRLQCDLTLDTSLINFGSNSSRVLELNNFDFKLKFQQSLLTKFPLISKSSLTKRVITALIMRTKDTINEKNIGETHKYKCGSNYSGYFQDWMYADAILMEGNKFEIEIFDLSRNLKFYVNDLLKSNPILVHVRLGDYLKYSDVYEILPEEYYLTAIRKLREDQGAIPVWLVAEDKDHVKNTYPNLYNLTDKIIDRSSPIEDFECFYLMTRSKNLVASNSTYSLWASWFALNRNANVIVPGEFKVSGQASQIIDGRWESIDLKSFNLLPKSDLRQIRNKNYSRFNRHFLKL